MYKSDSLDESDGAVIARETAGDDVTATKIQLNSTNLYQTVNLQAGQIYEVVIKNDDHKAVLTWDYESLRNEILFTIYETEQPITVSNGKFIIKLILNRIKFIITLQKIITHLFLILVI